MVHYEIHFSSGSIWNRCDREAVLNELRALRRHNSIADTIVERHTWVNEISSVATWSAENFLRRDYRMLQVATTPSLVDISETDGRR